MNEGTPWSVSDGSNVLNERILAGVHKNERKGMDGLGIGRVPGDVEIVKKRLPGTS